VRAGEGVRRRRSGGAALALLGAAASGLFAASLDSGRASPSAYEWRLPPGFPQPCVPDDNPMNDAKVELGRRLFYDPRLSGNGTQACASCHRPERAFTDGRDRAVGSTGERHPRGSQSLANVAYNASFTWVEAGRRSLEEQALGPMYGEHPIELGAAGHEGDLAAALLADSAVVELFVAAFPGEPLDEAHVRKAIAAFERTLLSGDSAYDRFVWQDDRQAMSDEALRGMRLFFSPKLACSRCHEGFTFSGPVRFDGLAGEEPATHDTGLGGRFRAPTLRNVAATAPYMHDGRFATLDEVLDYYAAGGSHASGQSPLLAGFGLSPLERCDLVAFLESLTDEHFLTDTRFSDPGKETR
jgi:cytochrome c peroxidase